MQSTVYAVREVVAGAPTLSSRSRDLLQRAGDLKFS